MLLYQLKAFQKGEKPGVYDLFPGEFCGGKFMYAKGEFCSGWKWRRYFRVLNKVLKEYNYIHVEREIDGKPYQVFYIFRENTLGITPEMLLDIQKHHREIGLAVGIPEFAVEEFVKRNTPRDLYGVKIRKLGLVFTMERTEEDLKKLEEFLKTKNLTIRDVQIK